MVKILSKRFMKVKKTNRMEFRIENVMKKTGDEHNFKRRS